MDRSDVEWDSLGGKIRKLGAVHLLRRLWVDYGCSKGWVADSEAKART